MWFVDWKGQLLRYRYLHIQLSGIFPYHYRPISSPAYNVLMYSCSQTPHNVISSPPCHWTALSSSYPSKIRR